MLFLPTKESIGNLILLDRPRTPLSLFSYLPYTTSANVVRPMHEPDKLAR